MKAGGSLGLEVVEVSVEEFGDPKHALRALWQRGIDGLYAETGELQQLPWGERDWLGADWSRFAVVKWSRIWPSLRFHLIRHSAFDFMLESLRQVVARGYRRIGVLLQTSASRQDELARIGAFCAFERECLPKGASIKLWKQADLDRQAPLSLTLRQQIERFRPDAILAFPYAWIDLLSHSGFRVPADFGFAALYSFPENALLRHIAGCDVRATEIASRAVHRLYKLLELRETGMADHPVEDVIEPVWVDGETLPGQA